MGLWIVYTGWQGNGEHGVIVDAATDQEARLAAHGALVAAAKAELDRWPAGDQRGDATRATLTAYEQTRDRWRAEAIELPYIGEFG